MSRLASISPAPPPLPPAPLPSARRARWAVTVAFVLVGFVFASWVLHVPTVRDALALSERALGFALLWMAAGGIAAMPLAGAVTSRWGSGPSVRVLALLHPPVLLAVLFAPSAGTLATALALFGATGGLLDVAMNAHGVAVERALGRPVLSSFHASFSAGGLAGAGLGGLALGLGVPPLVHVSAVGLLGVLAGLTIGRFTLPATADLDETRPEMALASRAWRMPAVWLLGGLGFLCAVNEGGVADWGAVYLRDALGAGPGVDGLAFAAFMLSMMVGRFVGDALRRRFSDLALLGGGSALAGVGLSVTLLFASTPLLAAPGFAVLGFGLANAIPLLYRAADRAGGPGGGISAVAAIGRLGVLAGPPVIGFVAEATSLRVGLGLMAGSAFAVALLAPAVLSLASRPRSAFA